MGESVSIHTIFGTGVWTVLFLYTAYRFVRCVRMVPQRQAYIVERLGKYHQTLEPGFHILVPFIDKVAYVQDLKEEAIEVPPQECFTKDNVKVEVDGVLYLSVVDAVNASYGVVDYRFAAIQLAQTTTRSVVGTLDLDRTFEERDEVNSRVVSVLSEAGHGWGLRVHRYEVKGIVPPPTVRDAMERQMAAERDRRATLASAEGQKTAQINESEGRRREAVNKSEGEMQRRINEAQGQAEEILAIARATAESIEKIGSALASPGGIQATNLRLNKRYFDTLGQLAKDRTSVLLPTDLTGVDGQLRSIELSSDGIEQPQLPPPERDATVPSAPAR